MKTNHQSDVALLVTFNQAIYGIPKEQPKGPPKSQGFSPPGRLISAGW
jgi:hypothetical protein